MIVIGAKGHAKELVEIFYQQSKTDCLYFFDNISEDLPPLFLDKFPILRNDEEVLTVFKTDASFALGLGVPKYRNLLAEKLKSLGGKLCSVISYHAIIAHHNINLQTGLNIMPSVIIYNNVSIGEGTLLNSACTIHHDVQIGQYCEISPGARILGGAKIGDFCLIGSNAAVLPNISIGNNVTIGAGAIVTKNVPDNEVWVGVPAKKYMDNHPLNSTKL